MPLGAISIVSFGFGVIFGKNRKKGKTRKIWAKRVPTPQRGVPSPQRGRGANSGMLRRSVATPRRSNFTEIKFLNFVSKVSYWYTDCLGTLIND